MALFKKTRPRGLDPAELSTLILEGEDLVEQLAQAHGSWGLRSR